MNQKFTKSGFFFLLLFSTLVNAQTITTIAGNGVKGYNGDNIAATVAQLNSPAGITFDNSGNLYISDFMNNRIRKVDANGFITTTAGTGVAGYNGDNIPATSAQLYSPVAIAFDQLNNLYLSDGNNNRMRKVSSSGAITTFAGTGIYGFNGDNIAATVAQVNYPTDGVIVDAAGNIIFSDTYNHRIRKINSSGFISTIAGTGIAGYNGDNISATSAQINLPYGLMLDGAGNLYVVDGGNQRVRKISASGIITTIAGTGVAGYNGDNIQATGAMLNNPRSIVIDAAGSLFIADALNHRVRKVISSGIISTIAGNGTASYNGDNIPATLATLNFPNGLKLDLSGNLLIAELGNNRIRKVANAAVILPLTMTTFSVQLKNDGRFLHWQTSNEVNTQNFVVEFSRDGSVFSAIGIVNANNVSGSHEYTFTDAIQRTGTTFYRLKLVDKNGSFSYSKIVSINIGSIDLKLQLYPNPSGGITNISFGSDVEASYTVQITDILGKVISQIHGHAVAGNNLSKIDLRKYIKGTYVFTLTIAENKSSCIRFVKE